MWPVSILLSRHDILRGINTCLAGVRGKTKEEMDMTGYYYDRREDETPGVVADAAFPALIQLFIPFPFNEAEKNFKKSLYFFIDRELFAYTDVIKLSFHKPDSKDPPETGPADCVIYRFATAYFLHCMVNRKLSSCRSELHELTGTNPDTFLLDELFKAANKCCNYHKVQKWLDGTGFLSEEDKYIKNSLLRVEEATKARVFNVARSSRFTLCDLSGHYEYSWTGIRYGGDNRDSMNIEISIKYPLKEYAGYKEMIRGLLENWGSRIFESFREEILEYYIKGLNEKEKEKLAFKCGKIDISDISFKVSDNFFWKLLRLKRRNTVLSNRFSSDLELMLFTLSVGENLETYEQLRSLRNKIYGADNENVKAGETAALKKSLLNYLSLGPERYMQALERLKDLLKAGVVSDSLRAAHDKVTIPNMPRMVLNLIALDRYTSGLEDIRRLKDSEESEVKLIKAFRENFIKTEVEKLCLITREEAGILLENDRSLGAMKEDLEALINAMPEESPQQKQQEPSAKAAEGPRQKQQKTPVKA